MKYSINLNVLVFLLIFVSQNNFACSPVTSKKMNLREEVTSSFSNSKVVAFVYVDRVEKGSKEFEKFNTHFKVLESFKGDSKDFSTGWLSECCTCEMHFIEKSAYIVYAYENDDGTWFISGFGPSKELSYVTPKELRYLRKLKVNYKEGGQ
jgi:hypothetical protein